MAMPNETVFNYDDCITNMQVIRDPVTGASLQIKETMVGKTTFGVRCIATKQVDTGFTKVQLLTASPTGFEPYAMASDDPSTAEYNNTMFGWTGSSGNPITDLLTLCRTDLFKTVFNL